jgi:hypothetical protein
MMGRCVVARTYDQELADMGVRMTAGDVLDDEELAQYCREGGKPWDTAVAVDDVDF